MKATWILSALPLLACASEAPLGADDEPADMADDDASDDDGDDDGPVADPPPSGARALLADGDPDAAELTELLRAPANAFCPGSTRACPGLAVDLEFNPAREGELWVVFRQPYAGEPCNAPTSNTNGPEQAGCTLLRSMVAIVHDATSGEPDVELLEDGNSWHFMRLVTSLAFADNGNFATVGEARTGNYLDDSTAFMGPTLWSSDPQIFAQEFMLNGSHLDMLHATPFGMGIAHQFDHVFWAFNGDVGSLDRYDFREPHVPGGEDHSDGEYARFATGELQRQENVPSHMDFGPDGRTLYVADTGNGRIVTLDTESGDEGVAMVTPDPQLASPKLVSGAALEELVPPGVLTLPSGLDVWGEHLIVSDAQTSWIHLFDLTGEEVLRFDTGLPEGALAGLTVGPDDKLYFVDWPGARVLRIDPR